EVIGTAVHRSRILIAGREEGPPRETQSLVLARLHGAYDRAGPIVSMRGIRSRGCIQGLLRLRIRVRDQSKVHVHVRLDRRVRMRSRRARFQTKLRTLHLAPGRHRLVVTARDAAGNLGRYGTWFRVCSRP
ncbi:MAG TPA: hypothetical protein VE270_10615, partial [Thermoleophilaceae bacterium]|nr:hypothetical protein [Thermoleophilaceae bacterium]